MDIAVLIGQGRISARRGTVADARISALALVLELLYLFQVNSLNNDGQHSGYPQSARITYYGVENGF